MKKLEKLKISDFEKFKDYEITKLRDIVGGGTGYSGGYYTTLEGGGWMYCEGDVGDTGTQDVSYGTNCSGCHGDGC